MWSTYLLQGYRISSSEDLDRIAILDTTHFYNQLIIGDEGSFTTLTSFADYGIITDKNIYVDGKITIKDYDLDVINGELYFNCAKDVPA